LFSTLTFLTEMIVVPLQEKRLSFLTYKQKQIERVTLKSIRCPRLPAFQI